jgi:hypothetical protein
MSLNILQSSSQSEFYHFALNKIKASGLPFLVGGGIALKAYTDIDRDIKDLDIFCKSGDYPRILKLFIEEGYETELTDARWLAQTYSGDHHIDLIFNSVNSLCSVDDSWWHLARKIELFATPIQIVSPEELLWCKIYIQDRAHYDGADVNHLILRCGKDMNWKHVLMRLEQHWQLLLSVLLNFRFVYPSERDIVPRWLLEELLSRVSDQLDLPVPKDPVCRGPLLSQTQYTIDIRDWNYKVVTMNP